MKTEERETSTVAAKRVPPGDRWNPTDNASLVLNSLTDALEYIYQHKGATRFVVDASNGIIYTLDIVTVEVTPEPPKKYSLYGED